MSDIIKVLPDHIANQIAAGEVIQRPASVVKELVENSVDAGATSVHAAVYDAGKSLIRISDNGSGMSETDARLCFERHATSKITRADDLFAITSFGFRGEALASIVAVAQVEMKTKRKEDKTGTLIEINGSELIRQEEAMCSDGTMISVRNLFYNVPARRKFLKSDATELNRIIEEFQRVALAYPDVAMQLSHNDKDIYHLPRQNLRQRIVAVFGKNIENRIIPVKIDTTVVQLEGFIGKPETATRTNSHNFFFVNRRFFKHPFFYKSVVNAYGNLIPSDTRPDFFLYFSIPPETIDVNIHPTKTEIKFENEQIIVRYITSCVRESLGKTNMMPAIDFDTLPSFDIPPMPKGKEVSMPGIKIDPTFNPFKNDTTPNPRTESFGDKLSKMIPGIQLEPDPVQTGLNLNETASEKHSFFQIAGKYIVTQYGKGMICIHQQRAHMRVLYEDFLQKESTGTRVSEKLLFPETITVPAADVPLLQSLLPVLQRMGFDMEEFGRDTFVVHGKPAGLNDFNSENCVQGLLEMHRESGETRYKDNSEMVAYSLARSSCMKEHKVLTEAEMEYLFQSLFACAQPSFTPSGKPVFFIMDENEFEKKFR